MSEYSTSSSTRLSPRSPILDKPEALLQTGDGAIAKEISPYNIKRRPLPLFTPIPETPSPSRPPALTPLYVSPPKTPSGNWRTSSIVRERAAREKAFQSLYITVKGETRCLPSDNGHIASTFIEDCESGASDSQLQIRDVFTDKDYALARTAEKMVQKRKELQEYRSLSQRHISSLINEIEELEEKIFHEILNNVASQQKHCVADGHGQFDGPQGLLYRVVYDLQDMFERKRN
ncbi:hypothetical protein M422DRAFT_266345 [Sphaerobolus stellatus SS14]|uniref:Uncharacterized protein n=1 Tax=Sphaerobolus stellatus (strain SS14) TaxID=990650 RepID=A0A0C9URM8_SPHS4|nr:hypothetical protein M422DRAFT_266345 [Sphaerobolus stellatus SS14]